MSDECIFCSSDQVYEEYPGVIRCRSCWRIEVKSGSHTEEHYEGGHWLEGQTCVEHEFVNTGTQRSWCKYCDTDAVFSFERGRYIAHDDLELLQRFAKIRAKGDTA